MDLTAILDASVGRVTPGGVIVASRSEESVTQAFGRVAAPDSESVDATTIYDVASLTKIVVTASLCKLLTGTGQLRLDHTVGHYLGIDGPASGLAVSQLLTHRSGLPDWLPFYQSTTNPLEAIASTPLSDTPNQVERYSDLGFILLGAILARIGGQRLDQLFSRLVAAPLNLVDIGFAPNLRKDQHKRCAPTEFCNWRGYRLRAEVHDENAAALGGVAGHAGLFSTASAVHRLAEELLNAFHGRDSIFSQAIVRDFWDIRRAGSLGTRILGWDTISTGIDRSSAGHYLSLNSVGHLGFTGCSLWIDPPNECIVVILTNRVFDGRENIEIKSFRRVVHDHLAQLLGYRARRVDSQTK